MHQLASYFLRFFSSATWAGIPLHERRLFGIILLVHFLLCVAFVTPLDFTSDEIPYQGYSGRWITGHPERVVNVDDSKSPIVFPALTPILLKPFWKDAADPYGLRFVKTGRYFMYLYVALTAFVMLCFSRRLWGAYSWVIPLCCLLLDPTFFSNAILVGSDVASMSLLLATLYTGWRMVQTGSSIYWWRMSVLVGLAVVAKASLVYLLPLLVILMAIGRRFAMPPVAAKMQGTWWRRWLGLVVTILLVINVTYYFHHSFFPISQWPKQSLAFQQLAQWLNVFTPLRVPLPYDFVTAFDMLQLHKEQGGGPIPLHTFTGVSILGNYYRSGPVWYYYVVSGGFKIPLFFLLLMMAAVAGWLFGKRQKELAIRYLFIWLPAVYFLLILSLTNPFQIGLRHALLIFPLLYLGMAPLANKMWRQRRKTFWTGMAITMALWLSFWPNMIAYTNELLWPKKSTYKYLYHSTVSAGHTKKYLRDFLATHPDYQKADSLPRPGKFAATLESIAYPQDREKLAWLRYHFEPTGTYRHTILLYHITEKQLREAGFGNAPK